LLFGDEAVDAAFREQFASLDVEPRTGFQNIIQMVEKVFVE
jgi:hypothetical protein